MNQYLHKINSLIIPTKYSKWHNFIIERALLRASSRKEAVKILGYCESHHILPKSFNMGGKSDPENIVFLSAREHFLVHVILTKMLNGKLKSKMIFALQRLNQKNVHQKLRYFNSKVYSTLKINRPKFVRLYYKDKVKYFYEDEILDKFIDLGWSYDMTPEFKVGRVGNMKGRTHSLETKERMHCNSSKPWLGKKRPKDSVERGAAKRRGIKLDLSVEEINIRSTRAKRQHIEGKLNTNGKNNPMYGRPRITIHHPLQNLKKIIFKDEENWELSLQHYLNEGWLRGLGKRK